MKNTMRWVCTATAIGTLIAGTAWAQRGRHRPSTESTAPMRVITIPVGEADNMMRQMRVWLLAPPPGATAFGLGTMGEGHRVWVLLPSCREPNPDDPRDPCPVGRVALEVVTGEGTVAATEPQGLQPGSDARRVQSFVVPPTVAQVRVKILRHDNSVRYEAAVEAAQLHQLPAPEGHPEAGGFAFDLSLYPSR